MSLAKSWKDNPLVDAVLRQDWESVEKQAKQGVDLDVEDGFALRIAAFKGQTGTVRTLIDEGADVNARGGEALRLAVLGGHVETAQYLVAKGAKTDVIDMELLQYSAINDNTAMVGFLADYVEDADTRIKAKKDPKPS